jgi:hypothetical protein
MISLMQVPTSQQKARILKKAVADLVLAVWDADTALEIRHSN